MLESLNLYFDHILKSKEDNKWVKMVIMECVFI